MYSPTSNVKWLLSDPLERIWKQVSWRNRGTIAWEKKTINMLRLTGDPAGVLAIRLRKWTKSIPYSYDDDDDDNNTNSNYNKSNKPN